MFSPNGHPETLLARPTRRRLCPQANPKPLELFRNQLLVLKGVHNRVRGDNDSHMHGMSCLLTGHSSPATFKAAAHPGWLGQRHLY